MKIFVKLDHRDEKMQTLRNRKQSQQTSKKLQALRTRKTLSES